MTKLKSIYLSTPILFFFFFVQFSFSLGTQSEEKREFRSGTGRTHHVTEKEDIVAIASDLVNRSFKKKITALSGDGTPDWQNDLSEYQDFGITHYAINGNDLVLVMEKFLFIDTLSKKQPELKRADIAVVVSLSLLDGSIQWEWFSNLFISKLLKGPQRSWYLIHFDFDGPSFQERVARLDHNGNLVWDALLEAGVGGYGKETQGTLNE